MSCADHERRDARNAWTRHVLTQATEPVPASTDAGMRSYWRTAAGEATYIVMDAPPAANDLRPWLQIRDLLEAGDVRVPRVLAHDLSAGFVLMEDLGGPTLAQVLDAENADRHFDDAIGQLLHLQAIALPAHTGSFDEVLLQRDAGLFEEWFLRRHLGLELSCEDTELLQLAQRRLMDNALAQAQVAMHRDFMPRNLMPMPGGPAVLDFQDLVRGPIAYDPISLFKDAFVGWPLERVDGWLARYHARAVQAGLPVPAWPEFLRDADWLGIQRHLKVLGIFARLHYRDGKPHYLADAPRFIAYLDEVLPRHPQLQPLSLLLERTIKPAIAARTAAQVHA